MATILLKVNTDCIFLDALAILFLKVLNKASAFFLNSNCDTSQLVEPKRRISLEKKTSILVHLAGTVIALLLVVEKLLLELPAYHFLNFPPFLQKVLSALSLWENVFLLKVHSLPVTIIVEHSSAIVIRLTEYFSNAFTVT